MLAMLLLATCVETSLQCGARVTAEGCTRFTFDGRKDDLIAATMRPAGAPLSNPRLSMDTGLPDFHAPVVIGGKTSTLRYILPRDGTYVVTAESSSRYLFAFDCAAASPTIPRDCVRQYLTTGETVQWELTADACRFSDANRLATPFYLYGIAGDPVTITLHSVPFPPRIAVYTFYSVEPLLIVDSPSATFIPPATDRYWVMATTARVETTGSYELTMSARASGCVLPIVVREPPDVSVTFGERATVTADVDPASPDVVWEWLDMSGLPSIAGSEPQLVTPPVTGQQFYAARVTTGCGSVITRTITVSPVATRRHASR